MGPKILLLLCLANALRPGYSEPKSTVDEERARLPEFLTELDLASLEASEEDIEALKTVVKRLAPEKNGEYQVYQGVMGQPGVDFPALTTIPATTFSCRGLKGGYYADMETNCQVFHICDNGRKISFLCPNGTIFQQSQLICDWWFKVDCSKSTELYEQSAEQLADEERKRSDAKRMKSEFHRSSDENDNNNNSNGGQNYYKSKNTDYNGRQNGRTNTFASAQNKNQIPGSTVQRGVYGDSKSPTGGGYDPNEIYSSNTASNQFNQINDLSYESSSKARQQQQNQSPTRTSSSSPLDRGNFRAVDRQQNQLVEGSNGEDKRQFNYEQRGANKFAGSTQDNYNSNNNQQQQSVRSNQQTSDYSSSSRNSGRDSDRRNFAKSSSIASNAVSSSDYETISNRVTPSYTETTTFRTSTSSPIREYQQLAESAAFATNRGNRFNEAYSSSQFNSYYNSNNNGNGNSNSNGNGNSNSNGNGNGNGNGNSNSNSNGNRNNNNSGNGNSNGNKNGSNNSNGNKNSNNNGNGNSSANKNSNNSSKGRVQQKSTEKPRQKSITPTPGSDKIAGNFLRVRVGPQTLPFPTFQPIYKPRTSSSYSTTIYESTTLGSTIADTVTTTNSAYTDTDYYTQNSNQDRTSYTDKFDYGTTTTAAYQTTQDFQATTETSNTDAFTEDYQRNSVTPSNDQTAITNTDFFENTTPTIITSGTYVNAKAYANSRVLSSISSGFTTSRPPASVAKNQDYRQNSVVVGRPVNGSTVRRAEASYHGTTPSNYRDVTVDQNTVSTRSQDNRGINYQQGRALSNNSAQPNSPSSYRQSPNSISSTTEKSSRSVTSSSLQNGATGKTLSPYDTSFTYQQGKVMSTLGPYVPFTKNYAYSTTTTSTTSKPPAYTATVPTYSSTASNYRSSSAKSLTGKSSRVSAPSPARSNGKIQGGSAAYLPEKKSEVSTYISRKNYLNERPSNEREHALSMLQSLRGLEGTVPSLLGVINSTRSGLNIPPSSGPSTLHSLALYFATASDDYDSTAESRTDSAAELQYTEASSNSGSRESTEAKNIPSVELPRTILTQHTINSYAELFNLNNALEGNSSSESNFNGYTDPEVSGEDSDDLDIQQSEGPVDAVRKSNSTRLRELAQVFTHALSAYLQDPDTFKKILTEIRPTEPSIFSDAEERFTATTFVPTTSEEYPSVTKEKDEVLDFSDDTTPPRSRRPTTVYPATTTDFPVTTEGFTQQEYYTTSGDYYTSPSSPVGTSGETSNDQSGPDNNFAFQVNHAFGPGKSGNELSSGTGNGGFYYPEEATGPSGSAALGGTGNNDPLNDYTDNYFPTDDSSGNKRSGFQNNTPSTYEPYGKYVKPFDATPISDNYVASSTPATYVQHYQHEKTTNQRYSEVSKPTKRPRSQQSQRVTPSSQNSVSSYDERKRGSSTTRTKNNFDRKSPTTEPFRIRYYDTTTIKPRTNNQESLVTAGSVYSNYRNNFNSFNDNSRNKDHNGSTERPTFVTSVVTSRTIDPVTTRTTYKDSGSSNTVRSNEVESTTDEGNYNRQNDRKLNDHWTSSPTVTQLWESTVFVDPEHINQGLVSGNDEGRETTMKAATIDYTGATERGPSSTSSENNSQQESLVTDATSSGVPSRKGNNNVDYPSSPWQWAGGNSDSDSPTAFTLLPQISYSTSEQPQQHQNIATATPSPIYTTRSSITTTITSSVTSTSSSTDEERTPGQDGLLVPSSTLVQQPSAKRPKHGAASEQNDADPEIVQAHNMFGNLNTTSTNTLMKVMKQADTNATVRQLVLLLINHCNGPMNKTMEEEKEQLLDALLRMPVNEFTSEESRELVAGINRLNLPIGRNDYARIDKRSSTTTSTTTTTTSTTEEPIVTTFRSKKGRRFKSNAEEASPSSSGRNDDIGTAETSNALSLDDTAASDARALELLRSLYTIAAKWG